MNIKLFLVLAFVCLYPAINHLVHGKEEIQEHSVPTPDADLKAERVALKTDDNTVQREAEAINPDGFSVKELEILQKQAEKHEFQAEVNKLMNIIINSLYSQHEIFLRELISNASDALDKIRFLSLTNTSELDSGSKMEIKIKADKDKNTLTISDTGIGMTKDELIKNLGTIAQSGTTDFVKKFSGTGDNNLIGQFGVGFYSVFLVADTVTVTTKHNGDKQYVWQSDAHGSFTVSEDPRGDTLGRGTAITLHLKEDADDYLDQEKLKSLVTKYSEFINFPIYVWASHEEDREVPMTEEEIKEAEEKEKKEKETEEEDEEEVALDEEKKDEEEKEADEEAKPRTKTIKETVFQWELMNETKPLWTRSPKEITDEEYNAFYKAFTKETTDPMMHIHFTGEGDVEFKSLLYIPSTPPSNMFDPKFLENSHRLKLYVKRVFITDEFKELLPKYLSFIQGIVDSDDLPLNVSREMLQEHKMLGVIKKKLIRKAIAMFQKMAEEEDNTKFKEFFTNYGVNIKLGVIEDTANRARLSKLLMFHSSKTGDLTTLDEYVKRMKEDQKQIYYLPGENKESVEASPLLERLVKKGYEVLYMVDPIDEYCLGHLEKFDGKYKLTNISREGLKFDGEEEDQEKEKEQQEAFSVLTKFLKSNLSTRVEKVIVSNRLTNSPSALVSSQSGWTANMERILKAQALADPKQHKFNAPRKILEINPRHPLIKELLRLVTADENDQSAKDIAGLMYETAALQSGWTLDDTPDFATRIQRMMHKNLGLDPDAVPEEEPEPVKEEKPVQTETSSQVESNEEPATTHKDEL